MPKDTETQIIELLKELKDERGLINVSLATMAESTGLSASTVHRAIKSLEDKGVISTYRKKSTEPQVILYKCEDIAAIMTQIENMEETIRTFEKILENIKAQLKS